MNPPFDVIQKWYELEPTIFKEKPLELKNCYF